MNTTRPHVVIVGAGFGGVYTAQALLPYVRQGILSVTLINKTNYFLFTPLLHEVATGGLSANSVTEPIREIFHGTDITFIQGAVSEIDTRAQQITVEGHVLMYDYAVISTGATTNFYGISGAQEHSIVLKDLSDAVSMRENIIDAFEDASCEDDNEKRKKLLTFAVVGGGATGVEMVAEMAEFIEQMAQRNYLGASKIQKEDISVHLINTGKELLMQCEEPLRIKAENRLRKLGVLLHMGVSVTEVKEAELLLGESGSIHARTIFWAAGVTPSLPTLYPEGFAQVGGRLVTDSFLKLKDNPHVFVLGDSSCVEDVPGGKGYPPVAQVAVQQAELVAENIARLVQKQPLKRFSYTSKGTLVSLGRWYAVGTIFGINLSGKITWFIWRTVYLFKFNSWKKRIKIMSEWTQNIFFTRDITKLQ